MGTAEPVTFSALRLRQTFGRHEAALLGWATPPLDDWLFGRHEAALLGWATPPLAENMVWADRDEKMKTRYPTPQRHLDGHFPTRMSPGVDSLDIEGNTGTKQDPLSSRARMPG